MPVTCVLAWVLVGLVRHSLGGFVGTSAAGLEMGAPRVDKLNINPIDNLHQDLYGGDYVGNNVSEPGSVPMSMLDIDCSCQMKKFEPAKLTLHKKLVDCDYKDVLEIKRLVSEHGVLVLNNVMMEDDEELVNFTSQFGDLIQLPGVFTKQSHASDYVAVITNIFEDGTVDPHDQTAGYWHNDGDFWQNNYLYNFLLSKVVPQTAGETGFLDLREAFKHVACQHGDLFNTLMSKKVCVRTDEIPDFVTAKFSVPPAYHKILDRHVVTGEEIVYYGHRNAQIWGLDSLQSEELLHRLEAIISDVDHLRYIHKWRLGQMLIWDNTLVMHRAMGNVGHQPRLLLRTQAKLDITQEM